MVWTWLRLSDQQGKNGGFPIFVLSFFCDTQWLNAECCGDQFVALRLRVRSHNKSPLRSQRRWSNPDGLLVAVCLQPESVCSNERNSGSTCLCSRRLHSAAWILTIFLWKSKVAEQPFLAQKQQNCRFTGHICSRFAAVSSHRFHWCDCSSWGLLVSVGTVGVGHLSWRVWRLTDF